MVAILMSANLDTPGLLKIKVFKKKGFDVIIYVPDVTNKTLWRDSNYIVDVTMWLKFGNSGISIREVIRPEKPFFLRGAFFLFWISAGCLPITIKSYFILEHIYLTHDLAV